MGHYLVWRWAPGQVFGGESYLIWDGCDSSYFAFESI